MLHLKEAARVYDELAAAPNWVTIECFEARSELHLSPEEVHRAVMEAVEARVLRSDGVAATRAE